LALPAGNSVSNRYFRCGLELIRSLARWGWRDRCNSGFSELL